jgi:hypothetical protein
MTDELIPYFLQVPDLELARLKQTEADLESLAKYRSLKMQAYDSWSKSMGKEFTYYNKDGVLEKVDVVAKRADAAATQDGLAGTEIGPAYAVRKVYKDYLSNPEGGFIGSYGLAKPNSPLRWTPVPPPLDLTWFDKVCLWFQRRFNGRV